MNVSTYVFVAVLSMVVMVESGLLYDSTAPLTELDHVLSEKTVRIDDILQDCDDVLSEKAVQFEDLLQEISANLTTVWRHRMSHLTKPPYTHIDISDERHRSRRSAHAVEETLWHSYLFGTGVGNREVVRMRDLVDVPGLTVFGPEVDFPPLWQATEFEGYQYLFGLFPSNNTVFLHIVKTDLQVILAQKTADFNATDLRVSPLVTHTPHGRQLLLFVKHTRFDFTPYSYHSSDSSASHTRSDHILCFSVDRTTLQLHEACTPVTVPSHVPVTDLLTGSLHDPVSGDQHTVVIPLQSSRALIVYKLSSVPYHNTLTLSVHASISGVNRVWRAQMFSVAARSYVVAAFGDGPREEMVQVFRYDGSIFSLVQKIAVDSSVIDLEMFRIGNQWYLALAQYESVSLFLWHVDRFQLIQTDNSHLTYKWITIPVQSCRNELILAKVFSVVEVDRFRPGHVEFYVHSAHSRRFEMVSYVPCRETSNGVRGSGLDCFESDGDSLDLRHIVGVQRNNETFILIPSKLRKLIVVRVNVSVEKAVDPVLLENQLLYQRLDDLKDRVDGLRNDLDVIESRVNDAVVNGSHEALSGSYTLSNVTANSIELTGVEIGSIYFSNSGDDFYSMLENVLELANQTESIQAAIQQIQLEMNDVVYEDDMVVNISGNKSFTGHVTIDQHYSRGHSSIHTVNGLSLSQALDDIVTTDTTAEIRGQKTFSSDITVSESLFTDRIAGRDASQLMTSHSEHQILDGSIDFHSLSVHSLKLHGKINDIGLDRLQFVNDSISDDDSTLRIDVYVGDLVAPSIFVDYLNDQQPSELFNVLTSSASQAPARFSGHVHFNRLNVSQHAVIDGDLNSVNVSDLLSSVQFTHRAAHVPFLHVDSLTVIGDLTADSVNDAPFPHANWILASNSSTSHQMAPPVVTGYKSFSSSVFAQSVFTDRVNGIDLTRVFTLDSHQNVSAVADLHVERVHFNGSVTITGTVNDVDFDLASIQPPDLSAHNVSARGPLLANVVFESDVMIGGDLIAQGVNGRGQVAELFSHVVRYNQPSVNISRELMFLEPVRVNRLYVKSSLNDRLLNQFATVNGLTEQLFTGSLAVHGSVHLSSAHVLSLVDGVNVSHLASRAIYTDKNETQIVGGVKVMLGEDKTGSNARFERLLAIEGKINNISADDVMWTHIDQMVMGPHTYPSSSSGGGGVPLTVAEDATLYVAGSLVVDDSVAVAGLDLSELHAFQQRQHALAMENGTFHWPLRVPAISLAPTQNVTVERINGVVLADLLAGAVTNRFPLEGVSVAGHWHFDDLQVDGDIVTLGSGQRLNQFAQRAISLTEGGLLTAPLHVEKLVMKSGARVTAPAVALSGTLISDIARKLVSSDPHTSVNITGSKTFLSGAHVSGSVNSTNLPLSELLTTQSAQSIHADIVFNASVSVSGEVTVGNPVNGLFDLSAANQLLVIGSDAVIHGDIYATAGILAESSEIHGLLGNGTVSALFSRAISLDTPSHLSGHITFESNVTVPALHITSHQLNGRDVAELLSGIRRVDRARHVFSTSLFVDTLLAESVVADDVVVLNRLNTVADWLSTAQNSINCSADFSSSVRQTWLTENLVIHPAANSSTTASSSGSSTANPASLRVHSLNGAAVSDLYRRGDTLERLHVRGNVLAQHVNIDSGAISTSHAALLANVSDLVRNLVPLISSEPIHFSAESLVFSGHVKFKDSVTIEGTIAGINTSQLVDISSSDLLILQDQQFENVLHVENLTLPPVIDGVNVSQCVENAVYPDRDAVLLGRYNISTVSSHIVPNGFLDQYNSSLHLAHHQYLDHLRAFNTMFSEQCLKFERLYNSGAAGAYLALRYFDSVQEIRWSGLLSIRAVAILPSVHSFRVFQSIWSSDHPHVLLTYVDSADDCARSLLLKWSPAGGGMLEEVGSVPGTGDVSEWTVARLESGGSALVVQSSASHGTGSADCPASSGSVRFWRWTGEQLLDAGRLDLNATSAVIDTKSSSLYLLDTHTHTLRSMLISFYATDVTLHPEPVGVFDVTTLDDDWKLLVTSSFSSDQANTNMADTVSVSHLPPTQSDALSHVTRLGSLQASDVLIIRLRQRHLVAVADSGWSSLLTRPQGVKIFEYISDSHHRCIPVQHLPAADPCDMSYFQAGSLPDFFLVVVECNHGVKLFIDKGVAGFVEFQSLSVPGALWARVFHTHSSTPFLLINAGDRLVLMKAHMIGSALHSFRKGVCYPPEVDLL